MKHTRDFFFDAVDSMFNGHSGYAKTEVIKNDDGYELSLVLPGFTKEEVEISVEGNDLYINAKTERNLPCQLSKKVSRGFTLENIDGDSINASLENGVLTVKFTAIQKKDTKKVIIL